MSHNLKFSINVLEVFKLTTTAQKNFICAVLFYYQKISCGFQVMIPFKDVNL